MPITGEISLYFHIPFCKKKCPYCHFYVVLDQDFHKNLYFEALKIEWKKKLPLIQNKKIISLYFGGGTPSLFPEAIIWVLKQCEKLPLQNPEITVEMNPEDIHQDLIDKLAKANVNRISLGVQSLVKSELKTLGRAPSFKEHICLIADQIPNISIDLMIDIPNQSQKSLAQSLEKIPQLPIQHISLYNLTIEPHTHFYKTKPKLPSDSALLLAQAIDFFEKEGFARYEISAFSRKGYQSLHNLGYWKARPFLGYGPSAFSFWEQKRFRNVCHILRYARSLKQGSSPVDFEEKLPDEKRQRELLCIHLRLKEGVELSKFQKQHGFFSEEHQKDIDSLLDQNFLIQKNHHLKLSEKGFLFYDTAMAILV